jgi:two-component system, NarL family, invasion response regulator UvrY
MIHVLLADDHALVRDGLKRIIAESGVFLVVAEAADGNEALQRLRTQAIELALFDLSMPGRNGIELIKLVKAEFPALRILVLTMHEEDQYAVRAIRAGASGYLTKDSASASLIAAMEKIARGGMYVSPALAEQMALSLQPHTAPEKPHQQLSDREDQVFHALIAGQSIGEIAKRLNLSVKTISTYKSHIFSKLQMSSVAELVHYAIAQKLVSNNLPTQNN